MVNWATEKHGNPNEKGVKWDDKPSYCPECNGDGFKGGYLYKKVWGLFKIRKIYFTFHKGYQKGYTKGIYHYCGKCNHAISMSLGIPKRSKEEQKRLKEMREKFTKENSCVICGKYIYGYDNYEIGCFKYHCTGCFNLIRQREGLLIEL